MLSRTFRLPAKRQRSASDSGRFPICFCGTMLAMHRTIRYGWLPVLLALPAAGQSPFAWKDLGDGRVELLDHGKPALIYTYGPQWKPGAPEDRRRCCYIFPAYTPAGVSVLDDFPEDHWHHRGLFWAWPVVETAGQTYALWMKMTAQDHTAKTPVTAASAREDRLDAESSWQAGGNDIVAENVRILVLPVRGNVREIDTELTWKALGAPVTLKGSQENGKSYGGFSARFAARG